MAGLDLATSRDVDGGVIDAHGQGSAVHVSGDDAVVRINGATVTGGHGELGGGLRIDAWADVTVTDCVFRANRASQGGGRAVGIVRGKLRMERCRFEPGEDLLLTGVAEVELVDCDVTAGLRLREGCKVVVRGGRIGGTVDVSGTTTRSPTLVVEGTALEGGIRNDDALPGDVTVR